MKLDDEIIEVKEWDVVLRIPRRSMYSVPMPNSDLLHGHLDRLLLAVMSDAPGHGYDLGRRLATRSDGELDVPEGSLYPALHRLERAGFVTSEWDASEGRRRRVYSLTGTGRRQLTGWRGEWQVFSGAVGQVLGVGT